MKKRIISLFLSLVMCLTLLPTTVFAATNYNFDVTVGGVTVSLTSDNCRDVFGDGKVVFEKDGYQNRFQLNEVHIDKISYRGSVETDVYFEINGVVMIDSLTKIETSNVSGTGTLLLSDKCMLAKLIHYDRPDGDSFSGNPIIYTRGRTNVYTERMGSSSIWAASPLSNTSKVFIYHLTDDLLVSKDFDQIYENGISLYGREPEEQEYTECFFSHYGLSYWGNDAAEVLRRDNREAPRIEVYSATKPAVEYPIWVAGVQVTSENKNDVLGNRKVSYVPATSEGSAAKLVLNGASITNGANKDKSEYDMISEYLSYAAIIAEQDLDIVVNGSCSIVNSAATATRIPKYPFGESFGSDLHDECVSRAIDMRGHNLIIEGDGSLTVSGNRYAVVDEASLRIVGSVDTTFKPYIQGEGWYIDSENGLHITGDVTMEYDGTNDKTPWKNYKNIITSVTAEFGSSVNHSYALFKNCSKLVSTDLRYLENKEITSNKSMACMFQNCTSLTSVNLKSFNTGGVKDMSEMFYGCKNLKSVYISGFDTSSVTDMSYMFSGCSSLENLDIGNFNWSAVKDIRSMFSNCTSLKTLNLGNVYLLSLPSAAYAGGLFNSDNKIAEITLNPTSVTMAKLSSQFYNLYNTWTNDATNKVYKSTSALDEISGQTKLIKGEAYEIWIGNVRVSSANRNDVLDDGGSVKFLENGKAYDPYLLGETLVLNNVDLVNKNYTFYDYNGTSRKAIIKMDYDLSIYLIGENRIGNTYEEDLDGIYVEWEDFVSFYGSGSLDISVSNNGGRAINAPGSTVAVWDDVTLKLEGNYGFYTDYTSDIGYLELWDNSKVYAYGLRTDDDKEGNAICTCYCWVCDNAYLYCEYEWNQPAFASWGEDFYYDTPVQVRGVNWRNFPSKALQTLENFNEGNGNPYEEDYYILEAKAGTPQYTVTFNMNGHGYAPASQKVEKGKTATKPVDPTASGYDFGGWYADSTLKTVFDFTKPVDNDTVIYAKWTKSPTGVTVSGKVTSFGKSSEATIIQLFTPGSNEVAYETIVTGLTADYTISGIAAGTYTMTVSKTKHATREYTVTVSSDTTQNAEIRLYGDITGDGEILVDDYSAAVNAALASDSAVPENLSPDENYIKAVADFDCDGVVDVLDIVMVERIINKHI